MNTELDHQIFSEPSGEVRGYVTALIATKQGKMKQIAHTCLMVSGEVDISLHVPSRLELEDLPFIAALLQAFHVRVNELNVTPTEKEDLSCLTNPSL